MTANEYRKIYLSPRAILYSSFKMYLNFLWYFIPIGAIPFLFSGFEWNRFNIGIESLVVVLVLSSLVLFIPCAIACYIIHFRRSKNVVPVNLSPKEAGNEVAKTFL